MRDLKAQFIQFALQHNALQFGEFTLKSGRISPYFFNAGLFNTSESLAQLGEFYAKTLQHAAIDFDMLFGPAYKGISLACATGIASYQLYQRTIPLCFNRKEVKDHGEGGQLIGAPLEGRVLMIDDVITAGTAFRETQSLIEAHHAQLAGVIIALDRQERGQGTTSAIHEIENQYHIPVISIIQLADLIDYLGDSPELNAYQDTLSAYQQAYGCE